MRAIVGEISGMRASATGLKATVSHSTQGAVSVSCFPTMVQSALPPATFLAQRQRLKKTRPVCYTLNPLAHAVRAFGPFVQIGVSALITSAVSIFATCVCPVLGNT